MQNHNNINFLLNSVKTILKHQDELERIKGEKFNVFSILKMESKENSTHSAFIGELLNPKGSHLKGTLFLELFLQYLNLEDQLDFNSTSLTLEKFIGKRDDEEKIGGRIDIYLEDKNQNSISIENKVYASDQYAQIERYVKHNSCKNKVLYLTLNGEDPSLESKGNLISDEDFKIISYKQEVVAWLENCLEKSYDSAILRESIKQYIILIKKLTKSMQDENQEDLLNLLIQNYNEAEMITNNFYTLINKLTSEIRDEIIDLLNNSNKDYFVSKGGNTSNVVSQIWIELNNFKDKNFYFGIESFSAGSNANSYLFVGLYSQGGKKYLGKTTNQYLNEYWPSVVHYDKFEDFPINFKSKETLLKLNKNKDFRTKFIKHIVDVAINFIESERESLITIYEESK